MQNDLDFYTTKQLAKKLNVSEKFIRHHIASRRMPGMRRIGRLIRFSHTEIELALLRQEFLLPRGSDGI